MRHYLFQQGGTPVSAIIAERGEVYRDASGKLNKITNKAPSHDDGLIVIDGIKVKVPKGQGGHLIDATQVLSASQNQVNTGKRKDSIKDEIVAVDKDEAVEFAKQFGVSIKVGNSISPSQLFEKMKKAKDELGTTIGKNTDDTNIQHQHSRTSFEANMAIANALPTDDEIFENVFQLQESKKDQSGVNFDMTTRKYGGIKLVQSGGYADENKFLSNWFKQRAGFDVDKLPINLSESTPAQDISLRSNDPMATIQGYYNNNGKRIVLNKNAQDKKSTYLHEVTHEAQYSGLPNYDYRNLVPRTTMAQQMGTNRDYLLDPKEVHSRLMQYRRDNELDPNEIIGNQHVVDGGDVTGAPLEVLNTETINYWKTKGIYQDYGVIPTPTKTLKENYKDPAFIKLLRNQGVRGDVKFADLSEKDKKIFEDVQFQYEDEANFKLYQESPTFFNDTLKKKGFKVLKNPMDYNLPTGDALQTILNGLTDVNSITSQDNVQFGGNMNDVSIQGYRDDSPYKGLSSNMINSNQIDMSATGKPLVGISNTGDLQLMEPYSGQYKFDGDSVLEVPLAMFGYAEDGGPGPRKNGYTSAQIRGITANNEFYLNKIKKATDYLKNPNIPASDRARIEQEVADIKKNNIIVLQNENGIPLHQVPKVTKPIVKISAIKPPVTTGEGNIGAIDTDVVVKPYGQTHNQIGTAYTIDHNPKVTQLPVTPRTPSAPVIPPYIEPDKYVSSSSFSDGNAERIPLQQITEQDKQNKDLQWYDVAGDIMNLVDAQNRTSPLLQQVQLPRIKLARGSIDPQVNAVRENFLTALGSLSGDGTAEQANINQLMTNANQQEIQLLAQGRNADVDIQNREEIANQAIIADETMRNLQLKQGFIKEVLLTDEAQRKQTLTSFQNIFDKIAKNNRFNKTENAFQSVFGENFRVNEAGRIEFTPSDDNPIFIGKTPQKTTK